MSDTCDGFTAVREVARELKKEQCTKRLEGLQFARELANRSGMDFCGSGTHFQLVVYSPSMTIHWLYNLHPTTGRIYSDPHHKGPFLKVPPDWTFTDVVNAAIKAKEGAKL